MARRSMCFVVCCSSTVLALAAGAEAADVKRGWGGSGVDYANYANARWYYNWGPAMSAGTARGEFVPMVWGNGNFNNDLNTAKSQAGAQYLLGFNEPERTDQANMSVATAISRWPAMMTAGLKLVSPAVSDTTAGRAWIADFMSQANANSYRVDAVAFHWYGTVDPANPEGSASGFLSRVDSYYNLYQKPVWITEWGGIDWGGAYTTAQMNEANRRFLIRAIAGLESRSYVERYAWWNWSDDTRVYVNGATSYTPSIVGNEYIPALMTGEVKDIAGAGQGYDYFYLRGGELTNSGAAQSSAVRFIDAIDGTSTISGTGNWSAYGDTVRVRSGATLQKTGGNQVNFNGVSLSNEGTILVNGGTLLLENGPTISGGGIFRVDAGTLALGVAGDARTALIGQPLELRGGTLASNTGVQNLSGPVTLANSSVINTVAGTLVVNGAIGGDGSLTFEGAGTTLLSNSNTYTGNTYVDAGAQGPAVVRVARSNPFGSSGTIYFNAGGNNTSGRIEVLGDVIIPNSMILSGRLNPNVAIQNISGSNTFLGTLSVASGGSYYVIQSDAGTLTFSGTLTSAATGTRIITLQGMGDGVISGAIQNGAATMGLLKSGAGTWTLSGVNGYSGATTVNAGKLVVGSPLTASSSMTVAAGATVELAAGNGAVALLKTPSLNVSGKLDLQDNKLIMQTPVGMWDGISNYTGVTGLIKSGRNGGGWTGNGIVTSQAPATTSSLTTIGVATAAQVNGIAATDTAVWAGQTVTGSDTLVMYTYGGDANLDGKINVDDYGRIDFAVPLGIAGWSNGDFNYDGKINVDDYGIIDFNVGIQGMPLATTPGVAGLIVVPEPASAAVMLAAATMAAAARRRRRFRRLTRLVGALGASAAAAPALAQNNVTFSTVTNTGYAIGDIDSCAVGINNLTTVGNHQFIAYYDSARNIMIGRRDIGSSAWTPYNSGISISSSEITDDHNVIAMTVDSAGFMHLSWDMHNVSLNYAISDATVTDSTLSSISLTTQNSSNAPTLFPGGGATTNSVTYPQFYDIPNSDNLLFTYRNGSSGSGNQYFNVYDPAAHTWSNNLVINGNATGVNAYLNTLAYSSTNDLMMSWTWRATPNWQSNSNIMFARSPDHGTTWYKYDGTTQYTLPIIQSASPATSVAEVIQNIPQDSSLINQTSMTVDGNDRPLIATYWTPNWNVSTNTGDPNRQYMLVYHDGAQWRTSQVSKRASDTSIDTSGSDVRDLGRPIVLTDNAGRVLVVTRSQDTAMGSYSNPATTDNEILVYYNTVASLDSATPAAWQSITLDATNMGSWEPTYDAALWKSQNKLALLYEPVGLGQSAGTIKVLEWDEPAYFANPPMINYWKSAGSGNWDTAGNWTVAVPDGSAAAANFGNGPVAPSSDSVVTINGTKVAGSLTFTSPTYKYSLVPGASGALSLDNGASAADITVNSGSHTIAVPVTVGSAGVNVATNGSGALTISGSIGGSGGMTKTGPGILVLAGSNTYGGITSVSAGTLRVTTAAALSANTNLTLNDGMLESNVNLTRTLGTSPGRIRLPGGTSGFAANGADVSITINNGGTPLSWGTPDFAPTTLVFNNSTSTNNVNFTSNISLNSAARTVQVNGGLATLSGVISSNSGSLQAAGTGTLVLSRSNNTYGGGTTINARTPGPGVIRAAATGALGTGNVIIALQGNQSTARLELQGGITLPNTVSFNGRTNDSVAIENISGSNTIGGLLSIGVGGNRYWVHSDAGKLALAGGVTSGASGARNLTLRGSGDGVISGNVTNGAATLSLTKEGSGIWTLTGSGNSYTGSTAVNAGKLVLSSPLTTSSSMTVAAGATAELTAGSAAVLKTPSLTVGGRLDIKDNQLITAGAVGSWNGSAYTGITGLIQSGRNGGDWDGNGIVTTSAAGSLTSLGVATAAQVKGIASSATAVWAGQIINGSDTLVMYTYIGDATLDGKINVDDYGRIDFNVPLGVAGWFNGDFNYDGKINVDDYGMIDFNVGIQGAAFATSATPLAGFAESSARAAVPEPGMVTVVVLSATLAVRRRRRASSENLNRFRF